MQALKEEPNLNGRKVEVVSSSGLIEDLRVFKDPEELRHHARGHRHHGRRIRGGVAADRAGLDGKGTGMAARGSDARPRGRRLGIPYPDRLRSKRRLSQGTYRRNESSKTAIL